MKHLILVLFILLAQGLSAQDQPAEKPADPMSDSTFTGLSLRSVGPAFNSGRVVSFAVNPRNRARYLAAAASGGVWKTVNAGTTWTPVFDGQSSYSIGVVVLDPKNPDTVWVGTGENNAQRSVGYGDGVYRSDDGGRTWRNMGLKKSGHIGRIAIDPRDSSVVYVAAQGPLWGPGGDRGLYKSTDGGKTWKQILTISENTGVTDVVIDPFNPDVLLAAAWQRRRHVWTLINGGPECALYKSADAGANWRKVRGGLPSEDMGRMGLAFSPARRGLVYLRMEAAGQRGGVFRSLDAGESWERRNPFESQPMYYGQIIADPKDPDRVFIPDVRTRVSGDGGLTLRVLGDRSKHVDTHTLWIDPENTDYILAGCDGGIYESFDSGRNWRFKANLPVTQFYDVTADNSKPFYYVYGGTQDNATLGGPSRTRSVSGINNFDWFVVTGGDGFHVRVDPDDPNTVYAESQYAGLVRFDRRTGERVSIKPVEGRGEPALRWNWDSPLIISPFNAKRLYFGANRLFRSDDRGNSWRAVSGDLTRQLDRDALPVMGKIWRPEAVAKHQSTSQYGNLTALSESPKKEGLLYVGTDDGWIQVTENAGGAWRKIETFTGVPERTYVARILASQHEEGTVYAAFDNHKNADFKPYLLRSRDKGAAWEAIQSNLPENGPVLAIAEDHVNPQLLFVGTEFGLYFTIDGGAKWIRLRGGLPTIAVRDIAIQKRENDLVVGTFGRGIYILDDYTPLRTLKPDMLKQEAAMFPVKDATIFLPASPLGGRGKGWQGESFFTAPNPPAGAAFTYYLKDALKTKKQLRQEAEREAERKKAALPYPAKEQLGKEDDEEAPAIVLTVSDAAGKVVRRIAGSNRRGLQRVSWDLRVPSPVLVSPRPPGEGDEDEPPADLGGHFVLPGTYKVSLAKRVEGVTTPLGEPQTVRVLAEDRPDVQPADRAAAIEFQQKAARLQRAVSGASEAVTAGRQRITAIQRALASSTADNRLREEAARIDRGLLAVQRALRGDERLARRYEDAPPSISARIAAIAFAQRSSLAAPTKTHQDSYQIAATEFAIELAKLRTLIETDLKKLEKELEAAGVPHTPGRIPDWK